MTEPSLKAEIWVKAQIRLCDINTIPAVVTRRGDSDAGAVYLKLNRFAEGCEVLAQVRTMDGRRAWMRGTGETPVAEADADAYLARQVNVDPDVWIVEIEDTEHRYQIDGEIV